MKRDQRAVAAAADRAPECTPAVLYAHVAWREALSEGRSVLLVPTREGAYVCKVSVAEAEILAKRGKGHKREWVDVRAVNQASTGQHHVRAYANSPTP